MAETTNKIENNKEKKIKKSARIVTTKMKIHKKIGMMMVHYILINVYLVILIHY